MSPPWLNKVTLPYNYAYVTSIKKKTKQSAFLGCYGFTVFETNLVLV